MSDRPQLKAVAAVGSLDDGFGGGIGATAMTESLRRQYSRLVYQLLKHDKSYLFRKPVQEYVDTAAPQLYIHNNLCARTCFRMHFSCISNVSLVRPGHGKVRRARRVVQAPVRPHGAAADGPAHDPR